MSDKDNKALFDAWLSLMGANHHDYESYRSGAWDVWRYLNGDELQQELEASKAREGELVKKINGLFSEIKHGDQEHQDWLEDKINSYFDLTNN